MWFVCILEKLIIKRLLKIKLASKLLVDESSSSNSTPILSHGGDIVLLIT